MSELLFQITIPGRVAIKKNSKRILKTRGGKNFIASSVKTLQWERMAIVHLSRLVMQNYGPFERMIKEPVSVSMVFNFKNRAHESDIDNCFAAPLDVLQKAGVLENDRLVMRVIGEKRFCETESVEIKIFKYINSCEVLCG